MIYWIQVNETSTIGSIKEQIGDHLGVPRERQKLLFRGKALSGEWIILDWITSIDASDGL